MPSEILPFASMESMDAKTRQKLPESLQFLGLSGVFGFFASLGLVWLLGLEDSVLVVLAVLFLTALPLIFISFFKRVYRAPSAGLFIIPAPLSILRVGIKLCGLAFTLGIMVFLYWLVPEYSRSFYSGVWDMVTLTAFPLACGTVCYFFWIDRRMSNPHDGFWHAGLFVLGRSKEVDGAVLRQHALAWAVKGFFLPLMLAGALEALPFFLKEGFKFQNFAGVYICMIAFIYALDVTWGALGYLLTFRILDSHIRSTDSTPLGWISAMICYVPFSTFIWGTFLKYRGSIEWYDWLEKYPVTYVSWGFIILILNIVYVWSTVSFGCRFSNLTNRGIITGGPYQFVRHPAYLSKNLAWWFMYVPFAAHLNGEAAVKGCICLLLTNALYVVRAKTEERHLMRDPAYVSYCQSVTENGLWAHIKKLIYR